MKKAILILGAVTVAVGAASPIYLPQAPSSLQSNETLKPVGIWLIDNGNYLALFGLLLILIAAFIPLG